MKWFKLIPLLFLLAASLFHGHAFGELVEGRISDINLTLNTFRINPAEENEITDKNIFIVRQDTVIKRANSLWDLEPGDKIQIDAKKLNKVVWKANQISKV